LKRFSTDTPLTLDVLDEIPASGPEMFIQRLKANQSFTYTIFSKDLTKINVHWAGNKSAPHYKQEDRCPGCISRQPKRFKAYLHCFCHEMGQEVFLELTAHSAKSLETQLGKGTVMRGNRIQVKRGKTDNGRLTITLLTAVQDASILGSEKDPIASLMALWGVVPTKDRAIVDSAANGHANGKLLRA
jgi:hypothetical protein